MAYEARKVTDRDRLCDCWPSLRAELADVPDRRYEILVHVVDNLVYLHRSAQVVQARVAAQAAGRGVICEDSD